MQTGTSTHKRHTRRTNKVNFGVNPPVATGPVLLAGGKQYFEIGGINDEITSVQFRWFDATSSGTFTVQSTNLPFGEAATDSTDTTEWAEEAEANAAIVAGGGNPAASAQGTFMLHLGNSGAKRVRVTYNPVANSEIEIISFGVD